MSLSEAFSLGSGRLALLATVAELAAGCPAVSRPSAPSGTRPGGRVILASALIRQGGGYNSKTCELGKRPA